MHLVPILPSDWTRVSPALVLALLTQGANSSFEGAYRLAKALRGAATHEDVLAALRSYEIAQMERVHWIVERSAQQGKTVYEDRDEFMRKQQEAQDSMWGVRFEPLAA